MAHMVQVTGRISVGDDGQTLVLLAKRIHAAQFLLAAAVGCLEMSVEALALPRNLGAHGSFEAQKPADARDVQIRACGH